MTTMGVTTIGFVRARLDVLFQQLVDRLKAPDVLGSDAVLDGTTPDGQIAGIMAEIEDILLQFGEDSYNAADPNNAQGAALYRLGILSGITPNIGRYGTVQCLVHVREGETLAAGSVVRDKTTGATFALDAAVGPSESDSHDYIAQFTAQKYDTLPALTTHDAEKVSDVYEWIDVSFYSDGSAGMRPETPAQFRQRRQRSTAKPSQGMHDSLYAALANISGVGDVKVFVNRGSEWKDIKPGDGAMPAHSSIVVVRNSVVIDGVDQVRQTIWIYGNPACLYYARGDGSNVDDVVDTQGSSHPIGYYVSVAHPIDVELTYRPIGGEGFGGQQDEDALKAALSEWVTANCMPGDDLRFMNLVPVALGDTFAEGYRAPRGKSGGYAIEIEGLRVGPHGGALASQNLVAPFNRHVSLSRANVILINANDL